MSSRSLKIAAGIIPFGALAVFGLIPKSITSLLETDWWPSPIFFAVLMGALPLVLGKVNFPHGKVTSIVVYIFGMYILLTIVSLLYLCLFLSQCL